MSVSFYNYDSKAYKTNSSQRNKRRKTQLLSVGSLFSIAACGGGGGNSPAPSPSTPPPPATPTNSPPTDIALSATTIEENVDVATAIGTLTTTDSDDTSHTYTVSDDRFEVVSGELRLKAGNSLNHEFIQGTGADATISFDITTNDGTNNFIETFTITVMDVNEAPTDIILDNATINMDEAGAMIGALNCIDEDEGDTVSYTVSDDRFEVVNGQLKLKDGISLPASTVTFDITAIDSGGLAYTESMTITVRDPAAVQILNGFLMADDNLSGSVSNAGDINGDGIDDLIIGANAADPNGNDNAGESYVVFGNAEGFSASFDLSSLDGSNGFVINGIDAGDHSGSRVSNAGDINGDGIDDLIIGAPQVIINGNNGAGQTYVLFGSTSGFSATVDLSSLDGSNGFVINGFHAQDWSGGSVSGVGDINGDDIDDLIIGASRADPNGVSNAGESYVIFGSDAGFSANIDLANLDVSNGFTLSGIDEGDRNGWSVSGAGDINGDGINDLIIGAFSSDPNGIEEAGESYVVFGSNSGFSASFDLSSLNGSNGFVINGIDAGDKSGIAVSDEGDVNGDGIDDLMVWAQDAGKSYVVFGNDSGFSASFDLLSLDGSNGFVINGIDGESRGPSPISSAGDINGDGINDLIIGAIKADPNGNEDAGESYVIFGSNAGFSASIDLSSLDGSNGFVLNGIDAGDWSGYSVSGAGDINGDGIDDLIIAAALARENYVIFGHSGDWAASYSLFDITEDQPANTSGSEALFGTPSNDVFDFGASWGDDTVSSFDDGNDMLDLADTGLVFIDLTISQNGSDTLIEDAGGNSILLYGITATDITADDFVF